MPDIIVTRSDEPIEQSVLHKIALFCNVKPDCVIQNLTMPVLYQAPIMLEQNHFSDIVLRELHMDAPAADMSDWNAMLDRIAHRTRHVKVALVGKYVALHDAYLSVAEALSHAGYENGVYVDIDWIEAEDVTDDTAEAMLGGADAILVPGGFGNRGIEGKIVAARYAREHDIPYLGLCLGLHILTIELARDVLGWRDADSTEFNPESTHQVIALMPDQQGNLPKGGTMRLGAYPCHIEPGTMLEKIYGQSDISERHRHRYEFNNAYREDFENIGLSLSGKSPDGRLVEVIEYTPCRFCVAVQYHPEFKSRPNHAHPLFKAFVKAALGE